MKPLLANPLRFRFFLNNLLVVCALALCSCAHVEKPKQSANIRLAPAPYFDSKSGIYFPGAINGLHRQSVVQLEERTPGLGVALVYRNSGAKLDIFSYDMRAPLVPNGADSPLIKTSFDDAVANIKKAADRGLYSNLQVLSTDSIDIANQQFLHARLSYGENLVKKDAHLFVSGVNGQILKIRITVASTSPFSIQNAISHLDSVILQSRQRGYGGITQLQFSLIEQALDAIDLSNGLEETEALAIAQMELVKRKQHNRFNLLENSTIEKPTIGVFTVQFARYQSQTEQGSPNRIAFDISPDGSAQPVAISQF